MPTLGLGQLFSDIKTSYIPALLLAVAVWGSCVFVPCPRETLLVMHHSFLGFVFLFGLFMLWADRIASFGLLCWLFGVYTAVLHMGVSPENGYFASFLLMMFLLPINALVFELFAVTTLKSAKAYHYLLALLLQGSIIEGLYSLGIVLNEWWLMPIICALWLCVLLYDLGHIGAGGGIRESSVFYALIAAFVALCNIADISMFVPYMLASVLILGMGSLCEYIYGLFRDPLTGVYSRRYYDWKSQKSFAFKYTLGVIRVDNFDKLSKAVGTRRSNILLRLIVGQILSRQDKATVYLYEDDEFVLVFNDEDKKTTYEYLENLRRLVAGTIFDLGHKRHIKITISAGVSEKKRSDADAEVVLQRIRETMQRTSRFTQNVTSKV